MNEDTILIVMAALLAIAVVGAVVVVHRNRQKMLVRAAKERERTLLALSERFGSAPDFYEFARSPEAKALFAVTDVPAAIARRLLAMVAVAIILLALGAGMWVNSLAIPADADLNLLLDRRFARWWGTLALTAGLGLLAAAAVCVRLAKRWGLL
jgi:hypothetical protein